MSKIQEAVNEVGAGLSKFRAWVEYFVGWLHWFAYLAVVVLLFGVLLKEFKFVIPYVFIPVVDPTRLVYMAGIVWLLKR